MATFFSGLLSLWLLSFEAFAADLDYLTDKEKQWLKQHPEIRLGVDPAWAPFEFIDDYGRYKGLASSYVSLIQQKLGIQMQPLPGLSWKAVVEKARQHEIDVLPCVVDTPQRREYLLFTDHYLNFPMVIVSREGNAMISGIGSIANEMIGVVEGYASYDLIVADYPAVNLKQYKTLKDGLEAVALGQIDYFVDNLASISHVIREQGYTNLKIAAQTPYAFKLGIGVRKDWPELVGILNKTLSLIPDSTRNEFQNKWISLKYEYGIDINTLIWSSLLFLSVAVGGYFFYLLRRHSLRLELLENEKDNLIGQIARALDAESGKGFFETLVKQLSQALSADIAFIGRLDIAQDKVSTMAVFGNNGRMPDFSYVLKDTPCNTSIERGSCAVPTAVQHEYPDDDMLVEMNIDGYAGTRLNSSNGKPLGILVVLTRDKMQNLELIKNILQIFGVRAAVEMERQQSAESLRKLSLAVQYSPNAVVITDTQGIVEYVNPRYFQITGYTSDDVIGSVHQTLRADPENVDRHTTIMYNLHAGKSWSGEIQNVKKDGSEYWISENIAPILDDTGVITHFVAVQEDITEAYKQSKKISYQAAHDGLTGLINRSEFELRLKNAVSTASEKGMYHALCFIDLDQFKVVNDTSGHVAGDEMLKQIGGLLKEHLRETDTLARLGGDEFAVLIENCSVEQAKAKAKDMLSIIEEFRFAWEDKIFTVGASIGITGIDKNITTYIDALKYADIACYSAKDAGRNRIHVYESSDENLMQRSGEMLWAPRITNALENDLFRLFVQEIKPTDASCDFVHYEVLLRMLDEDGELIPPGAFLPTAERYNLIHKLDMWVIDHVFEWLKEHAHLCNPKTHFAINLSGVSLGDEDILQHIIDLLGCGLVPASKFHFEVTETMAIANLQQANHFISTIRSYGCGVSLDDFGSGLSSFGYLKNLEVDTLKIDGMFVRDILDDPIDAAMVDAINRIGHLMGKQTVAEFVENDAIAAKLVEIKVDYVQGYGIGKPMPIEAIQF